MTIVVALMGASIGGYVLISRLREEIKPPGVTADDAIQILLDDIIKPDKLNHDLIAFMRPELLNPDDTIAPHDFLGDTYVMEDNTWFFWVNDFPFAMFSHPTRYVFIDALTGDFTVKIEDWWPQLNGEDLWETPEEYWDNKYWVYSTYVENSSTNLNGSESFGLTGLKGTSGDDPPGGNRGLIIEGSMGSNWDIPTSAGEWHYLMENVFGFDVTHLGPFEENGPTENNIDNVMDNLSKELKPCENFSIYITGHGRENDGAVDMGDGFHLTPEQFSEWVCRIENGVHITVTVAACYSGKWIPALKKWDNKVDVIYTSTDENSVGWGDVDHKHTTFAKYREAVDNGDASPDPNPDDVGLEAVSGLVEDMEALAENFKRGDISWVKLWQEAIKTAKQKDAAYKNSEFFKKWTEQNRPDLYPPCSGKGVENPQEWKSDKVRDTIPPELVSTSPENGQVNVPLNTAITVTFSEAMNKTLTQQSFSILPPTEGEFSWIGNTMIFTPSEKLIPETLYWVMISTEAMDQAGNRLEENYIWSFLTGVPPEVHSLSISANSPVTASGTSSITVRAYDGENRPVSGASISLLASAMDGGYAGDYKVELTLTDGGDGTYTSSLTSMWAGVYTLRASVEGTDITASDVVTFVPGPVIEVVASSTPPLPASPFFISTITFYFADAHGNAVPIGQVEPLVESSFGHLDVMHAYPNNTFSIDLSSMDWGAAEVTITDSNTEVSGSLDVEFPPLHLETEMDLTPLEINLLSPENLEMEVTWPENVLSVCVNLFVPPAMGVLNEYEMTIQYDNSILHFDNVSDADPADNFDTPVVEVLSGDSIKVGQKGYPPESFFDVFVLNFTGIAPGSGPISITDVHLTDVENKPIPIPTVVENKRENVKVFERVIVPMKAWILDNSGVTEDEVRSERDRMEAMYNKNAKKCKSKYWYVFVLEINHISENEWKKKMGADNKFSFDEMDNLVRQDNWGRWVNVYFVPGCTLPEGALGWWTGNGIWIDDNKDYDNLTLAHEFMHEFSKSRVKDSPADNAAAQGGRRPKNIMNYDDTGDDISDEQGKIIDEEIGKRKEDDLYKPYRPGPTPPP